MGSLRDDFLYEWLAADRYMGAFVRTLLSTMNKFFVTLVTLPLMLDAAITGESLPTTRPGPDAEMQKTISAASEYLDVWRAEDDVKGDRKMKIVYWTPADRDPAPGYAERLSRTMLAVQKFYRDEMSRLGLGARSIGLELDGNGMVKIHVVKGVKPYSAYAVGSGREIREECRPVLEKEGINIDKETIVLFCNMSNWDPEKRTINQNSPYYAAGNWRQGTAWQVDSPILDINYLAEKGMNVRDGQYGDISLGRYNSIFIGGITHELGHALGLPHCRECKEEHEKYGTALMGSGNRTLGEDLRGEGKGSYLILPHALKLATHPQFSGSLKGFEMNGTRQLSEKSIGLTEDGKRVKFSGTVTGNPAVYLAIGYFDPDGGGDYDAQVVCAVPDKEGRFSFESYDLKPNSGYQGRIVFVHVNGDASAWQSPNAPDQFKFSTDANGVPKFEGE
jgi:hypothetical protein